MALPYHFCFGLQQGRLCNVDLIGLKLSVILPTHALNYCVQKLEKCIKHLGSRLFMGLLNRTVCVQMFVELIYHGTTICKQP